MLVADGGKKESTPITFSDDGKKMRIWNKTYVKTTEKEGFPESLLFKGQYKSDHKTVTLNADGTIEGLDDIKFYSVENDYFDEGRDDIDILYLRKSEKKTQMYSFEFKSDTLLIYTIDCKEKDEKGNCADMQKGKLAWMLVK